MKKIANNLWLDGNRVISSTTHVATIETMAQQITKNQIVKGAKFLSSDGDRFVVGQDSEGYFDRSGTIDFTTNSAAELVAFLNKYGYRFIEVMTIGKNEKI